MNCATITARTYKAGVSAERKQVHLLNTKHMVKDCFHALCAMLVPPVNSEGGYLLKMFIDKRFSNLYGIQSGTLAQIIGYYPHIDSVRNRYILSYSTNQDIIAT